MSAKVLVGSGTDPGQVREENQDATSFYRTSDDVWTLLIVCDGMGGHAGGRQASAMAAEGIGREFADRVAQGNPVDALRESIKAVNRAIVEFAEVNTGLRGMGTTCVVLAIARAQAFIAHVGDSRVYRVRPGSVEQVTKDHSYVQRMIDSGILTPEQAEAHPDANMLMRCLGGKADVEVDVIGPEPISAGDRYILCSDGLWGPVTAPEIAAMSMAFSAQDAVNRLIQLANERGGPDNISVQIYHQGESHSPTGVFSPEKFTLKKFSEQSGAGSVPEPKTSIFRSLTKFKILLYALLFIALIIFGAVALFFYKKSTEIPSAIKKPTHGTAETQHKKEPVNDAGNGKLAEEPPAAESKPSDPVPPKNENKSDTEKISEGESPPPKLHKSSDKNKK